MHFPQGWAEVPPMNRMLAEIFWVELLKAQLIVVFMLQWLLRLVLTSMWVGIYYASIPKIFIPCICPPTLVCLIFLFADCILIKVLLVLIAVRIHPSVLARRRIYLLINIFTNNISLSASTPPRRPPLFFRSISVKFSLSCCILWCTNILLTSLNNGKGGSYNS